MSNRTVEAILRLSSKLGSMKAFSDLAGHLDKVDRKAKDLNRRQSMIAAGARDMHATLLRYAAPAAVAYGAKQAFVDFAELERRMTRIGITAGSSAGETREAFDVLQRGAKDFAMPIDQAVEGLDTLVSSGMSLKEALAFLPSVLATAQAAGATTTDIANTAQKAASALGLQAGEMQRAFDIMVTGGKAGQFELKDMAAYIPELANSFASLGYKGEEGLKELVAILQTIREDTGSAGAAATQAQNIFGKMFSQETANKFDDFGINLRKEMEAAKVAGEDAVAAFVQISKEAVDGDLSKLPLLFTDQEFRLGMQSLMTSADSYKRFIDTVNNSEVDGSTLRDLGRVLEDNQAKIDRMGSSWDKLKTSFGSAIADPAGGIMDSLSNEIDYATAVNAGLEKSGVHGFWGRTWWGVKNSFDEAGLKDSMAWAGGYRTSEQRQATKAYGQLAQTRREAGDGPAALDAKEDLGLPVAGPVPTPRPAVPGEQPAPIPAERPSDALIAKENFDREFDTYQAAAAKTRRDMR
ncbi:phage tail tape measure protein, partial [Rhizobiaceae sp. 2RAB30]